MFAAVSRDASLPTTMALVLSKRMEATMSRFVCPKCGEDEINELTVCVVSHPVKNWSEAGEPAGYGNPIVDWQSHYPYSIVGGGDSKITLECRNCTAQFEHSKRGE